jgi:ABC-type transporter Mla subunit MlaD
VVSAPSSPWHHRDVYLVLLTAAIAILAGVVVVAMGRGGEIARFDRDLPVTPPRVRDASDLVLLQLPIGLFGYQEQATHEALDAAARLLAEQDAEIGRLRKEVARLSAGIARQGEPGGGLAGAVPRGGDPAAPRQVAGQAWPQA